GDAARGEPGRAGPAVRPRAGTGQETVRGQGNGHRQRRRAAARRARLRQGASGGAVVPRPAGDRADGRRGARMINLEVPGKFEQLVDQAHQAAQAFFRPNSRKYDRAEHTYPKELDTLAALLDGLSASGGGAGAGSVRRGAKAKSTDGVV